MNNNATMDDFKNTAQDAASKVASEVKTSANKALDEAKSSGSAISNEVKNFIADLEEMVSSKTGGSVDIGKIKGEISNRIASYKSSAEAAGQQVVAQAKQSAEGVNTYVHDEPWKAIGVGFAVGLLLGVVISRR